VKRDSPSVPGKSHQKSILQGFKNKEKNYILYIAIYGLYEGKNVNR
jgi:hypothetical protein